VYISAALGRKQSVCIRQVRNLERLLFSVTSILEGLSIVIFIKRMVLISAHIGADPGNADFVLIPQVDNYVVARSDILETQYSIHGISAHVPTRIDARPQVALTWDIIQIGRYFSRFL
jgi:hypothetical protein